MAEKLLSVGYIVTDVIENRWYLGGGATGIAINGKNLGLETGLLAILGGDERSDMHLQTLQETGVNLQLLQRVPEATIPLNHISHIDRTTGWEDYGIGKFFSEIVIDESELNTYPLIHLASAHPSLISQVVGKRNRERGIVSYSPGPKISIDAAFLNLDCLRLSEVLFLSESEWLSLKKILNLENPSEILNYGPNVIVVTKGELGIEAHTRSQDLLLSALPIETAETTGAGDAVALGFLIGYKTYLGVEMSLELGRQLAFHAIQNPGNVIANEELKNFGQFLQSNQIYLHSKRGKI